MHTATVPQSVRGLFENFESCFKRRGFESFATMIIGWIVCQGRHSICRVIQASGEVGASKHHSSHYRFLSRGRWSTDAVGEVLFRQLLRFCPNKIRLSVDDTLCHKSGPHIFGAAMHYDSHASTYGRGTSEGRKGFFAFGHNWVIASLWIPLPWNSERGLAIPILFRLYRSKKRCPKDKYRKRTELATELVKIAASWIPDERELHIVGDAEYACRTLVRSLPKGVDFTGPMCMDAALYELPTPQTGRGRRRIKGTRLPSPKKLADSKKVRWQTLTLTIYGRAVVIKVKSMRCLWFTVAGERLVRMVVTRDPSGRINDRAYFTTTDESLKGDLAKTADEDAAIAAVIIEYARRWEIEVAFRNTKQAMGLEDPQNGWWHRPTGSRRSKKRPGPNAKEQIGRAHV